MEGFAHHSGSRIDLSDLTTSSSSRPRQSVSFSPTAPSDKPPSFRIVSHPLKQKFLNLSDPGINVLCGSGGIRTPGTLSDTPVFKTGAFNRSATLPGVVEL